MTTVANDYIARGVIYDRFIVQTTVATIINYNRDTLTELNLGRVVSSRSGFTCYVHVLYFASLRAEKHGPSNF